MADELNLVVLINPMVIYDGKFHFLSKTLEEVSHAPRSWQDEKTSFSKVTIYSSQKPEKAWPQRQLFKLLSRKPTFWILWHENLTQKLRVGILSGVQKHFLSLECNVNLLEKGKTWYDYKIAILVYACL